jgi:uridylate kinase
MAYTKIMLKLSGEALGGKSGTGINEKAVQELAGQIAALPAQISIVVGGGNILRGRSIDGWDHVRADYAGMTATCVNAQVLALALEHAGARTQIFSAIPMQMVADLPQPQKVARAWDDHKIVIFAGGLGVPGLTTDTTAAVRAAQLGAQVLLKATNVPGIHDKDPNKFPDAKLIPQTTLSEMLISWQGAIDRAAVALCLTHKIPIFVFDISEPDVLRRIVAGERIGTFVEVK